jgi:hypothetical protein
MGGPPTLPPVLKKERPMIECVASLRRTDELSGAGAVVAATSLLPRCSDQQRNPARSSRTQTGEGTVKAAGAHITAFQ